MTKKRTRKSKTTSGMQPPADTAKHVMPGFERGNADEIVSILTDSQLGENDFPSDVRAALAAFAHDAMRFAFSNLESLESLGREQRVDFGGMLAYAAHMGFAMALYRYADELQRVPELAAWRRTQTQALDKGHVTQSQAREANYQRIRDTRAQLEAEGKRCTYDAVAAACGCSRATVDRAINDRTATRKKR